MAASKAHSRPECGSEFCITCGDLAVEVRVVEVLANDLARVESGGQTEIVSIALVDAAADDLLLVHAGEAIAKLER